MMLPISIGDGSSGQHVDFCLFVNHSTTAGTVDHINVSSSFNPPYSHSIQVIYCSINNERNLSGGNVCFLIIHTIIDHIKVFKQLYPTLVKLFTSVKTPQWQTTCPLLPHHAPHYHCVHHVKVTHNALSFLHFLQLTLQCRQHTSGSAEISSVDPWRSTIG